jgi:hypothetical protein
VTISQERYPESSRQRYFKTNNMEESAIMVWVQLWLGNYFHRRQKRYLVKMCLKNIIAAGYVAATKKSIYTDYYQMAEFDYCLGTVFGQADGHFDAAAKELQDEVRALLDTHDDPDPNKIVFEEIVEEE